MTQRREPLRDVVARTLDPGAHNSPRGDHEDAVLLIAERVDALYVAVEKLTAAMQIMLDDIKQGQTNNATRSAAEDSTGAP